MEELLLDIADRLRAGEQLDAETLARLIRATNKQRHNVARASHEQAPRDIAKKHLIPYYLRIKREAPEQFASWDIDAALEHKLFETLRMKPRRTQSGVATVTVITKPWPCTGHCSFCPSDIRMPKSYLHNEPACQRAERVYFDPYLQVNARLTALSEMGHVIDKVELIVLGGTWSDYPRTYQAWFVSELFRALNEFGTDAATVSASKRHRMYEQAGLTSDLLAIEKNVHATQDALDSHELTYKEAWNNVYATDPAWMQLHLSQTADEKDVRAQHTINEQASCRCVGLVFETRPNFVTAGALLWLRQLGATKLQVGVQSLDQDILNENARGTSPELIADAFDTLRLFGFKVHAHFMANLIGATPASDTADFKRFVTDKRFQPDEIKMYPCSLIKGTRLEQAYDAGEWQPYSYDELIDVLTANVLATPAFTRMSRIIRDFSSGDIMAGSTYTNLRQRVEEAVLASPAPVQEIRMREIAGDTPTPDELQLQDVTYKTRATTEHFLQWVTTDNRIAGYLRLSLPQAKAVEALGNDAPISPDEAMIREVHVYGKVAALTDSMPGEGDEAQHTGLGKRLIERACSIAREAGYARINVISAIGTRGYYAAQGFTPGVNGLYQTKALR